MGMVYTARPYVICIIVNKSNLVKLLLLVSLLHDDLLTCGADEEIFTNFEKKGECTRTYFALTRKN